MYSFPDTLSGRATPSLSYGPYYCGRVPRVLPSRRLLGFSGKCGQMLHTKQMKGKPSLSKKHLEQEIDFFPLFFSILLVLL